MVFLLKVKYNETISTSLIKIRDSIHDLSLLFQNDKTSLSIADINHILYKCEKEELYITNGKRGVYDIPKYYLTFT